MIVFARSGTNRLEFDLEKPIKPNERLHAELREQYASVLLEPIPPRLKALVEKMRELERQGVLKKGCRKRP